MPDITPSLLQTLGRIVTTWAYVEMILDEYLAALIPAERGGLHVITANVSAASVCDWIRILVPYRFADEANQRRLNTVLEKFTDLRAERNALVHGQWDAGPEPGTAKIQTVNLGRSEIIRTWLVTETELKELAERIDELLAEMQTVRLWLRAVSNIAKV